jgi:hypothetical protein
MGAHVQGRDIRPACNRKTCVCARAPNIDRESKNGCLTIMWGHSDPPQIYIYIYTWAVYLFYLFIAFKGYFYCP